MGTILSSLGLRVGEQATSVTATVKAAPQFRLGQLLCAAGYLIIVSGVVVAVVTLVR
jgi:hypothetical protein